MSARRRYSFPVAAVDEDERNVRQVGRGVAGVVDLDEAAAVGADLVIVDLVDDQLRRTGRRRRWRASVLAREDDRAVDLGLDGDGALGRRARRAGDPVQGLDRSDRPARTRRPCRPRGPGRAYRPGLAARPGVTLGAGRSGSPVLAVRARRPGRPGRALNVPAQRLLRPLARLAGGRDQQDAGLVPAGLDHAIDHRRVRPRGGAADRERENGHAERESAQEQPSDPCRHRSSSSAGRSRDSHARGPPPVSKTARTGRNRRFRASNSHTLDTLP